jgi:CheY-like chemotaxis protein
VDAGQVPDLVVLDLMLPDIDGFEVLDELRRREATRATPVLVNTARDLSDDEIQRLNTDYARILRKSPTNLSDVLAYVADLLGTVRAAALPHQPQQPTPDAPAPHATVLVAEDNAVNQALIRTVLERKDYSVLLAQDGQEAIDLVQRHPVDLVLMDVQMPGMDGLEATRRLRQMPEGAHLPIIALTAHAMKGDDERCLAAGCDAYLSKPIEPGDLLEHVARHLATLHHTPAPEPHTSPPLDPAASLADSLSADLLDALEAAATAFESALLINDVTAIGRLGHALDGVAAQSGLQALADLAHRISSAAQQADLDALPPLLEALRGHQAQLQETFAHG